MNKQETLEKVVIDLLLENKELKLDVQKQKDSSTFWWKQATEKDEKIKELEQTVLTFTEPKTLKA